MRGRELKTFILPQLVEARKRESCDVESPISAGHSHQLSRSSTLSDATSPSTPTFSVRGHSRLASSTSSLATSPVMRESLDVHATGKRPLTDVREEPQDREEDYDMLDSSEGRRSYEEEVPPMTSDPEWGLYAPSSLEFSSAYDFVDDTADSEFAPYRRAKRRCAEDTPLSPMDGLTSRLGTRIPSFSRSLSRRWRTRKPSPVTIMPDRDQVAARSRANSTRAPSLAGSTLEMPDVRAIQLPPTPRRSLTDDRFEDAYLTLVNSEQANGIDVTQDEAEIVDRQAKPTTPLLPPILTQLPSDIREVPYQSPLQSPTVVDPEVSSVFHSPLPTPRTAGLPSPPLSSKPSISSFHRQRGLTPIMPSSEIPSMMISNPDDKWADQLGHANFTIYPEPYVAGDTTLVACKQLRTDWEIAQSKYKIHLARIGENYGATSKIFLLTEEKWNETNVTWKNNVELSFSRIPKLNKGSDTATNTPRRQSNATPEKPAPLTRTTSPTSPIQSPKNDVKFPNLEEGKFPTLGEEGIVGPMEVVAPQEPQRRKRKLGFFRWVQGVWPTGVGTLSRRSSH